MIFKPLLIEYSTVPNDGHVREVSSTQVELPELRVPVLQWAMANLDESDLVGDGIEQRPHVTVLYGIEKGLAKDVWATASEFGRPIRLEVTALDRFEHPERDVLFARIKSPDLHELNGLLRRLPNQNRFPKYVPHMTIAYMKKGAAEPFLGQNPFSQRFQRLGFTHSKADYTESFVPTVGSWHKGSPLRESDSLKPTRLKEAGRSTYVRSTRKVYRDREASGAPSPRDEEDKRIDRVLKNLVRDFDFSFAYSGDSSLARLAAQDFYDEVAIVAAFENLDPKAVMRRWNEVYKSWDRSSQAFQSSLRSLVRSGRKAS